MNSSVCMVMLLALATSVITLPSDKKQEEHNHQAQPHRSTLQQALVLRLYWLRADIIATKSWIMMDLRHIPRTVHNRLQDCCRRRRIDGE